MRKALCRLSVEHLVSSWYCLAEVMEPLEEMLDWGKYVTGVGLHPVFRAFSLPPVHVVKM